LPKASLPSLPFQLPAPGFSDDSVLMSALLSRVVNEHTQVMADTGDWATEIGRYPATLSGHSVENLKKSASFP
jgi:hypothetical protein